jgi:hypothetical protein
LRNVLAVLLFMVVMGVAGIFGAFAPVGICAMIWRYDSIESLIGPTSDRSHPATWVCLALAVPSSCLALAGALALYLPLLHLFPWLTPETHRAGRRVSTKLLRWERRWVVAWARLIRYELQRLDETGEGKDRSVVNKMTLQDLAQTLPNGFHDAELRRLEMDYVRRILRFDLVVWIGSMDDPLTRELYRPARLILDNVAFFVIEPPDTRYPSSEPGPIRIDAGDGQPRQSASKVPQAPAGTSMSWVYLEQLNGFLLFAAGDASLEWTGPEENRS